MLFKLYKMYQQPIQGQNQTIVYQYNNVPIAQNQNQLLTNNQIQYQRQLAQQKDIQRNQAQIQSMQNPQQTKNIQNIQILNAQKYQQVQNMPNIQNMYKYQQPKNIQNTRIKNTQIPHNINPQQGPLGQNAPKIYPINQIQKAVVSPQVVLNQIPQQNTFQTNINQGNVLTPQTNKIKQIVAIPLNLNKTPTLEPTPQILNQPHLQIQQKNHHHANQNQNQIQQQKKELSQPQNQQMMENLKNKAFLGIIQNPKNTQNPTLIKPQTNQNQQKNNAAEIKRCEALMSVSSLVNFPYDENADIELSKQQIYNISAYAANSYNGKRKNYNTDNYQTKVAIEKNCIINGVKHKRIISYFGLFDGHGGDKCSIFLKNNFHE